MLSICYQMGNLKIKKSVLLRDYGPSYPLFVFQGKFIYPVFVAILLFSTLSCGGPFGPW